MSNATCWLIVIIAATIVPVLLSLLVEALRSRPQEPATLYWGPGIAIHYLTLDGVRIRYIKTGQGPNVVLLHTLRTQLDIFEKVIPELARTTTVYALDYPGHGFSDIPKADYVPDLFVAAVEKFMDQLDIKDATLAGISIGGSIPLLIAAKHNPRLKNVVSINPYDYGKGLGVTRGNIVAFVIVQLSRIPILGETFMRLRQPFIEKLILQGGVSRSDALTPGFLQQVWDSGVRKGHYQGFINLIRNAASWESARAVYGKIKLPVLLVYGAQDWSNESERKQTLAEVPGAKLETIKDGGHFLSLDQPGEVIRVIRLFAGVEHPSSR